MNTIQKQPRMDRRAFLKVSILASGALMVGVGSKGPLRVLTN